MKFIGVGNMSRYLEDRGYGLGFPFIYHTLLLRERHFPRAETFPTLRQQESGSSEDGRNGEGGAVAWPGAPTGCPDGLGIYLGISQRAQLSLLESS